MAFHKCRNFWPCSSGWTCLGLVCVGCALCVFWRNISTQGLLKMDSAHSVDLDLLFMTQRLIYLPLRDFRPDFDLHKIKFSSCGSTFSVCNSLIFIVIAYQTFWILSSRLILPYKVDFTGYAAILSAIPNRRKCKIAWGTSQYYFTRSGKGNLPTRHYALPQCYTNFKLKQ